jgi:hypothetical protein
MKRVIKLISSYIGILLLSTTYKILSEILLARLTLCIYETGGDNWCGF